MSTFLGVVEVVVVLSVVVVVVVVVVVTALVTGSAAVVVVVVVVVASVVVVSESKAVYSAYKNDVILAYHWSIKMYTGLPLVNYPIIGHLYSMT